MAPWPANGYLGSPTTTTLHQLRLSILRRHTSLKNYPPSSIPPYTTKLFMASWNIRLCLTLGPILIYYNLTWTNSLSLRLNPLHLLPISLEYVQSLHELTYLCIPTKNVYSLLHDPRRFISICQWLVFKFLIIDGYGCKESYSIAEGIIECIHRCQPIRVEVNALNLGDECIAIGDSS
jgi:hypothetical protein